MTDDPRTHLEKLIRENGHDFAAISKMLGKNPAYIQQYIRRGSPKKLDEDDRRRLAEFYGVDERLLGAPAIREFARETRWPAPNPAIARWRVRRSRIAGGRRIC